jgi:short-subunit dehydrogenase
MIKVLVFGSTGGIGSCVCKQLESLGYQVIPVTRDQIALGQVDSSEQIAYNLTEHNPDWIINCAGVLGDNSSSYKNIFDVNVGTNWSILQHYLKQPNAVKIVMLGSSSYQSGRKNYMLYSSSKAALHNLWQGASEYFQSTNVKIGIVHFGPVDTAMTKNSTSTNKLDPEYVAKKIIDFCSNMTQSELFKLESTK